MRVLAGYVIDGKSSGIDRYLLRVLEVMKAQNIQFDFLTNHKTPELERIFGVYHANVIEMPSLKHPTKQYRFVYKLIKQNKYDIVYFNISEAFNGLGVLAAHRLGVKKIFIHAHNSKAGGSSALVRLVRTWIHKMFCPVLACAATDYRACSTDAGAWMFSSKIRQSSRYQIIHNAIDNTAFEFCDEKRMQMRRNLGIEHNVVIGHVGSYNYEKNNFFLLDIMEALLPIVPNAVLLAVGAGADWEAVKKKAGEKGLLNHIKFLGVRDDVPDLMQAMDFFVLPSRFEGQPIVAIEAQAAGLMTFLSDTITKEAVLSENCMQLGIENGGKPWALAIKNHLSYQRKTSQKDLFKGSVYDRVMQEKQIHQLFMEEK